MPDPMLGPSISRGQILPAQHFCVCVIWGQLLNLFKLQVPYLQASDNQASWAHPGE